MPAVREAHWALVPRSFNGVSHIGMWNPCDWFLLLSLQPPTQRKIVFTINHMVRIIIVQPGPSSQAYKHTLIWQNIPRTQKLSPKNQLVLEAGVYLEYTGLEQPRPAELTLSCTSCNQRKVHMSSNGSINNIGALKRENGTVLHCQLCPWGHGGWGPMAMVSIESLKAWRIYLCSEY